MTVPTLIFSCSYSNKNISFGIVDLGHFPNAADKFGISLGGNLCKGPSFLHTFILINAFGSIAQNFSLLAFGFWELGQLSKLTHVYLTTFQRVMCEI